MSVWPDVRKYDEVDWHVDGALGAGQPEENAATHIGIFVAWLIRHDLHNPDFLPDSLVAAVKAGEVRGSDALQFLDTKLASEEMTAEGAGFADWYYVTRYLDDYSETFRDYPDYGVPETQATCETISAVLDRRFAEWVGAGRPGPARVERGQGIPDMPVAASEELTRRRHDRWEAALEAASDGKPALLDDLRELAARINEPTRAAYEGNRLASFAPELTGDGYEASPEPHDAPELEALIRPAFGEARSMTAQDWGAPMVLRTVRRMGLTPREAKVAIAMGARGQPGDGCSVDLYALPGQSAARLDEEFRQALELPRAWLKSAEDRTIAARVVHWQDYEQWVQAWWTRDGLVVRATAPDDERLNRLIGLLP